MCMSYCENCDELESQLEEALRKLEAAEYEAIEELPDLRVDLVRAGILSHGEAYEGWKSWGDLVQLAAERMLGLLDEASVEC